MIRFRAAILILSCLAAFGSLEPSAANPVDFQTWLKGVRNDAAARGIATRTLDEALAGLAPIARVLELDRRQPEVTMTFDEYMARVVNQSRIDTGRQRLAEHRELLEQIGARYGVQPRFILALWAVESDFGRITGNFSVIGALATLAYDGRRSAFFREELLQALRILDQGHITPGQMRGSWAGAMGQNQFMPSSFLAYAIDHDGDGRRDIWTSLPDVFASIANYLARVGWRDGEGWGRVVRLPDRFDRSLIDHSRVQMPIGEWTALGISALDGRDLAGGTRSASLVAPGGTDGPVYMIFDNYRALLRWNRSIYFATAVGYLADQIGGS
jgi:membrane-bound lytic murein transglycosylase B